MIFLCSHCSYQHLESSIAHRADSVCEVYRTISYALPFLYRRENLPFVADDSVIEGGSETRVCWLLLIIFLYKQIN